MDKQKFERTLNGKKICLYTLENSEGMRVDITNYGARFVTVIVRDKNGKETDVVVGFDSIDGYLGSTETYYSALVGRYANRIAGGKFRLEGREYQLPVNNVPNHLHGGPNGFHVQVWEMNEVSSTRISFSYLSKDGEENYPGNLDVKVTYSLTGKNELAIEYEASTDKTTIINLTSHPFFNLNGQGSGSIVEHLLQINADYYTPVDNTLIPKGIEPVKGTPFDFTKEKSVGQNIYDHDQQLVFGAGYDHNYALNGHGFRPVAKIKGTLSGISMEVLTDEPGMQLYSGNYMKGENQVKYGMVDKYREAICLETQHYPDSPNQPQFPSTTLKPGELYRSKTVYKFQVED
jgi:aldose 1-epimerase